MSNNYESKKRLREEHDKKMHKTYMRNWIIAIISLALAIILYRAF